MPSGAGPYGPVAWCSHPASKLIADNWTYSRDHRPTIHRGANFAAGPRKEGEAIDDPLFLEVIPLSELVYKATTVHSAHFDALKEQPWTLLSIETGGCTEGCKYCSQSSLQKLFPKPDHTKRYKRKEVTAYGIVTLHSS